MKEIIDNKTGEIILVEEENELVEKKLYEVGAIDDDTFKFLNHYKEVVDEYDNFRFLLEQAMREHNISQWKTDLFTASIPVDKETNQLKKENVVVKFDEARFKKENKELWEKYQKLQRSKVGLQIRFKKGKD